MDIFSKLFETPIPTLFILAGIFFLVLSVANKLGAKIDINPKRQTQAILIGAILIIVGLVFYLDASKEENIDNGEAEPKNESNDKLVSVYSMEDGKTYKVNSNELRIHISRGGYFSTEDAERGISETRFEVIVDDRPIEPISEINYMIDNANDERHLQQFFKISDLKKGKTYKITGRTFDLNEDPPIDSKLFFIRRE